MLFNEALFKLKITLFWIIPLCRVGIVANKGFKSIRIPSDFSTVIAEANLRGPKA